MNSTIKPHESRALGWYAVRWTHVTDWHKPYSDRRKKRAPKTDNSETSKDASKEEKKLQQITQESEGVLIKARTVFPFTLFPDIITIDRHKLTIVYRMFFKVAHTVSVPIETIKNIQANLGPFFGSLVITSDNFINNIQTVNFLTRRDAENIQKMVQGAMVAVKENIDISKVETDKLKELLSELGEGRTNVTNA